MKNADSNRNAHLIASERKALEFRRSSNFREAAELFSAIVNERPDWEHGTGWYNLGCCYEELREFALAEKSFVEALHREPKNPIFLGGFASFLYLHGEPLKAFNVHLTLLEVESKSKDFSGMESTIAALKALSTRVGMSEQEVGEKIAACTAV